MINDQKIIAFTPCGRKRYMDLLTAHVIREHARGHIDKWVLFNNPYTIEDSTYADQIAEHLGDWVEILRDGPHSLTRNAGQISRFYGQLQEHENALYLRLDDDLVYIDESAIPRMVNWRLSHPKPFLVYPTIINNTRTSFALQAAGKIPLSWGRVENILCAPMAWQNSGFVFNLHQKALSAIDRGALTEEFTLPSREFESLDEGNISINSFIMFGRDMVACQVKADEEGYLSKFRPRELGRLNARCGDAFVIHFAYHTQTAFMDQSGMLTDYAKLAPPLGFRTSRIAPPPVEPVVHEVPPVPGKRADVVRNAAYALYLSQQRALARQGSEGLKA